MITLTMLKQITHQHLHKHHPFGIGRISTFRHHQIPNTPIIVNRISNQKTTNHPFIPVTINTKIIVKIIAKSVRISAQFIQLILRRIIIRKFIHVSNKNQKKKKMSTTLTIWNRKIRKMTMRETRE
ncbi:hypothetical protein HanIR_Chr10g0457551 [Helianthus annuus]|nr:hypothetical protein HanIR_Chr10g0457551 [Helianthus annuus]